MKKLLKTTALLLAACIGLIRIDVSAADDAQKCGEHITWQFDADTNTLILDGTGDMYNYNKEKNFPPWCLKDYNVEHLSVSEGITSIGSCAFYLCITLKDAELPQSVTEIGDSAFLNCIALCSLTMQNGLKRIGADCFSGCIELQTIPIPDTVTEIGENAFSRCASWYKSQKRDYIILGDGILCKYLGTETDLEIPEHVRVINSDFLSVPVYLDAPETAVITDDTKNTKITSVKIREGTEIIGANAFADCNMLTSISVPDTVRYIGGGAFDGTPWLKNAGDTVILGDGVLYRMQGRQKVAVIPETVRTVSSGAISGKKIVEIRIPDTVTGLPADAISCPNAVIAGEAGGIGAQYAAANGMPFRDTGDVPDGRSMAPAVPSEVWQFANQKSVFGSSYFLTDADRQRLSDAGLTVPGADKPWGGSCVGLSVTVILAKNGIFLPSQLRPGAASLSELEPTEDVLSFINYYQTVCSFNDTEYSGEASEQRFYRMLRTAAEIPHGGSPFLLTYATTGGSHGVVGCGQESGEWTFNGKTYDGRILLWDSNAPDKLYDERSLYYDSITFDYCIPHYGIYAGDAEGSVETGIISVSSDLSKLNPYPYPLSIRQQPGDLNCDGTVSAADAVLLCKHLTTREPLRGIALQLADLSGDKAVTSADLTLLKRLLLTQK